MRRRGARLWVCGVDEVGRGPLAGAVVAAAVVLDPDRPIDGLADSKLLPVERREELDIAIRARALAWSVGRAEVEEIDRLNILHASLLAMRRAVDGLHRPPARALIDGNCVPPGVGCPCEPVVGGDGYVDCISAAAIVAKVHRDREMVELDARYPGYGLASHKGYATTTHLLALQRLGPSPIHRRSFAPVARLLGLAPPLGSESRFDSDP